MRVSLIQPHRERFIGSAPCPLLRPEGAQVVLGGVRDDALADPVRPASDTLLGPRGCAMAASDGPLFVCDTGHHRLLAWRHVPRTDFVPADLVFGQPDFTSEGRNARRAVGASTLNVPTGVAIGSGVLAVADAWNHRVLLWLSVPESSNQPADVVLGQADFTTGLANRGGSIPAAETLNWCYGIAIHDGRLIVADTGNRRVVVWNMIPRANGQAADLVLGQVDFTTRDDHGNGASAMRWPHAVAMANGQLFVADAGSSRIMVWHRQPETNGAICDAVLGQTNFIATDHNRGAFDAGAATLNMPYGIAILAGQLVVADTANSRLLGFDLTAIATGAAAERITGQNNFQEKGENRWERPDRDGFCWPYGVAACGGDVIVADSGNNRVLLWRAA
jgi:hypothetical protein